ncbi:MAG: hypothetical protein IIA87_03055 [Nanoarchaeota archaeon]|nr:hypothetical protein [Nanoarchaeota archaeon]
MFKGKMKCMQCKSKISDSFDFCPYCGLDLRNPESDMREFGMLGKNEIVGYPLTGGFGGFGITDKMLSSLFGSLVKTLEKQMKNVDAEVESLPNGIKIRFGVPVEKKKASRKDKRGITTEQIERMAGLPRVEAKTNIRRLSDKVIYELKSPGIESVNDVFVSKLESGYEVKSIGKKKVYVNSLPVNLPLKGYSITDKGLTIEFGLG